MPESDFIDGEEHNQRLRDAYQAQYGDVGDIPLEEEEPIQVDAGYDDDCCNQIRQHVLQAWNEHNAQNTMDVVSLPKDKDGKTIFDFEEYMERIPCEEVLETFGLWELFNPGETLQDVYNECATGKMSHGDIMAGDPMDLAWRLLKHG
jgi:hypothetical protein